MKKRHKPPPPLPTGDGLIVWKERHWLSTEWIWHARYSDSAIFTGDTPLAAVRRILAKLTDTDPNEPDMVAPKWDILDEPAPLSRVKPGQVCFMRVRVDVGVRDPWSKEPGVMVTPVDRRAMPSSTTQHFVRETDLITQADAVRAVKGGT